MASAQKTAPSPEDIEAQLKQVRNDVLELSNLVTKLAEAKVDAAKSAAKDEAAELVKRGRAVAEAATAKAQDTAGSLENYVRDNPVQTTVAALLVGLVLGAMSRR